MLFSINQLQTFQLRNHYVYEVEILFKIKIVLRLAGGKLLISIDKRILKTKMCLCNSYIAFGSIINCLNSL